MGLRTYLLALVKPKEPEKQLVPYMQTVIDAKPRFEAVVKENHLPIKFREESMFAMSAIKKNEALQKCDNNSIGMAIVHIATVGLTLNPAYQYCYLVPHYNKAMSCNEAVLYVSYKGLTKLATDTGAVSFAVADVVRANDEFVFMGKTKEPVHSFNPNANRGGIVGAYCLAKLHDGSFLTEWMDQAQIDKCREAAKTKYVWDAWPEEMMKKSVIKRASKTWPKSPRTERLDTVVSYMNDFEGMRTNGEEQVTGEPVLLLSEAQIGDLRAIVTDTGNRHPDRQLNNLARSLSFGDITQVPSDSFGHAKKMLLEGLTRLATKKA